MTMIKSNATHFSFSLTVFADIDTPPSLKECRRIFQFDKTNLTLINKAPLAAV